MSTLTPRKTSSTDGVFEYSRCNASYSIALSAITSGCAVELLIIANVQLNSVVIPGFKITFHLCLKEENTKVRVYMSKPFLSLTNLGDR